MGIAQQAVGKDRRLRGGAGIGCGHAVDRGVVELHVIRTGIDRHVKNLHKMNPIPVCTFNE